MAKRFALYFILFAIIFSCNKPAKKDNKRQFSIGNSYVGYVTDSTQVRDLRHIFKTDSIVNYEEDDSFVGGLNPYDIYEKNGNHLLRIFPHDALDTLSTISHIQLVDSRFTTQKNISNLSLFKDIRNTYYISKIKNELDRIIIEIDSINSIFIINKNQLNRKFEFGSEIQFTQLSDSTKIDAFIKYF